MKKKYNKIIAAAVAVTVSLTPVCAYAETLAVGSSGSSVVQVQSKLKKLGYFTYHSTTGYYGSITESAVKNFQSANGLQPTGKVDDNTMALIDEALPNTTNESTSKGAIDWFSEVQYIFPRGGDATVTDVDTGKSFKLRRTYGTNHADVEPLTKNDTEIIKSIWGGFNWTRRAVVVDVGGYLIAGSMTAFPHAGVDSEPALKMLNKRSGDYGYGQNLDAVKGNGIDGHMDIHFLNSRTHGTNSVQSSHQDMVKKAHNYILNNY